MTASTARAASALTVSHLSKSYPGVTALTDVSLVVREGEVHGIVGENGAGKSTLMKSIAGAVQFDAGTVEVLGQVLAGGNPRQAADAGLAMIYQELTIVPELSAAANVLLGSPPQRFGIIRRGEVLRRYREGATRVGLDVHPATKAGRLSTAQQQLLEIMRAVVSERRLVIMDEPTASLGPEDIQRLHRVIRDLRATGHSVVYVSHDLGAVLDVCDTVTVLREGAVVESRPAGDWTSDELIKAMLGGVSLESHGIVRDRQFDPSPALTVRQLSAPGVGLDHFELGRGEIVGIAGLVGSGRTRLLRTLAGASPATSGSLTVNGRSVRWPHAPSAAWKYGIALAPEDRKLQGLVLGKPAAWNIALGWFARAVRGPVTKAGLARWAKPAAESMAFAMTRLSSDAGTLSGGNQQKLMLARLMSRPVSVLLLDEPTRGIDIGAKAQVFDAMRAIADAGRSIVWSSSEIEEVLEHSDRILIVAAGRVIADVPHGATAHDVLTRIYAQATDDVDIEKDSAA